MVRTKSGEQAKRLAAKLKAAAEAEAPPAKPAKPKLANPVHLLGDRRPEENPAPAEESAEAVSRAKTIAQTRKGAYVAAALCRTNFTEGLQGTSQEVVNVLGDGGLVPRAGWLGCMVPDVVRESENARFEIKEPKLPRPLRTAPVKPVATEQDHDSLQAPAPTVAAAPAASEGDGCGARLPSIAEDSGDEEGRATADPAAPSASAPGSSADHAAPPLAPPKGAGGSGDDEAEEPQEEPRFVLPAGSLRSKWSCGGELGQCPGCLECIEDHPDRVRQLTRTPSGPRPPDRWAGSQFRASHTKSG